MENQTGNAMHHDDFFRRLVTTISLILLCSITLNAFAASMNLADKPLFVSSSVAPLTMLVMGKDHKLYYEAYNDAVDLNGDGAIDVGYQGYHQGTDVALNVDYYGYFNSYTCYRYDTSDNKFVPVYAKSASEILQRNKTCPDAIGEWSGDFLNYITTARLDALRKVFYGGYRATDTLSETTLERTHIPHDAHAWGKEYQSKARDGYDIADYTPLSGPTAGTYHLLANVSLKNRTAAYEGNDGPPLLRVLGNTERRVWEWLSKERPVAADKCIQGLNGPTVDCETGSSTISDYHVRVDVCTGVDRGLSNEANACQYYPSGHAKPVGILQQFGEDESMMFGLLSGSFENNLDGGVLRKAVSSFRDEVNLTTGQFTSTNGIVKSIDRLRTVNFNDSRLQYDCGWTTSGPISNGQCQMWGNPVAEMMYETLRYFSGKASPTPDFSIASSGNNDASLGLPLATWTDPFDINTGYDQCATPFQVVLTDINPSYDSDKVPGAHSAFASSFTGDISGLSAAALADQITDAEGNIRGRAFFIGQSGTERDNAPTAKNVLSLASVRGMAPEEPTKLGSYYAASMAYYGRKTDLNPRAGEQNLQTFSVALASPLPTIRIDPDQNPETDNSVVVVPFAKSPGRGSLWNSFQPTNQIVDFYVESIGPSEGSFLINFEDVEQGADHDMDAIARYAYTLNSDGTITIDVDSIYAAGGIDQRMGYVISGTTRDGVYLEVRDQGGADYVYELDTPSSVWAGDMRGTERLGLSASRNFTPSLIGASAEFLKDPLWYAAKWGGFVEADGSANDLPDIQSEWDTDGDGTPDNYFLVTNALTLKAQMEDAFDKVLSRSGASSALAVNSGSLNSNSVLYQALFETDGWVGQVKAVDFASGNLGATLWEFSEQLEEQLARAGGADQNREMLSINAEGQGVAFRFPVDYLRPGTDEISADQIAGLLQGISSDQQGFGEDLVDYLRGDQREEFGSAGATRAFRARKSLVGDIVHSDPLYVIQPGFFFPDVWPTEISGERTSAPENSASQTYSDYRALMKDRKHVLYVGANDGALHAINAFKNAAGTSDGGEEILAYVPGALYPKLAALADPDYQHDFYVDGKTTYSDVFFSRDQKWHTALVGALRGGAQAVYALDISDPHGIASGAGYKSFDEANARDIVLWEFSDADDPDLGYTFGRPTITRLANGQWAAVFGNGYDNTEADGRQSVTGNAVLYIVDIESGELIKKFDSGQGSQHDPQGLGTPNGMSEPAIVDLNGDSVADLIYAGDLFGNLWKIDVSSVNPMQWDFADRDLGEPAPLFVATSQAGERLPITQQPKVGAHPLFAYRGDSLVMFGTGQYLSPIDNAASGQPTQALFGVWDDGRYGKSRSSLLQQSFAEHSVGGSRYRVVSESPIRWEDELDEFGSVITQKHEGWVLDLIDIGQLPLDNHGERSVSNMVLRDGRLVLSTMSPSPDPCAYGGSGWIMVLDASSGGTYPGLSTLDINNDGIINDDDRLDIDGDGEGDVNASAVQLDSGFASTPTILDDKNLSKILFNTTDGEIGSNTGIGNELLDRRLNWRELK